MSLSDAAYRCGRALRRAGTHLHGLVPAHAGADGDGVELLSASAEFSQELVSALLRREHLTVLPQRGLAFLRRQLLGLAARHDYQFTHGSNDCMNVMKPSSSTAE